SSNVHDVAGDRTHFIPFLTRAPLYHLGDGKDALLDAARSVAEGRTCNPGCTLNTSSKSGDKSNPVGQLPRIGRVMNIRRDDGGVYPQFLSPYHFSLARFIKHAGVEVLHTSVLDEARERKVKGKEIAGRHHRRP